MKKTIITLFALSCIFAAKGQDSIQVKRTNYDAMLPRWVLDINLKGGILSRDLTMIDMAKNYTNAISPNVGKLKFTNGMSYSADAQLGYFFSNNRHWGVGLGFMYAMQQGDLTLSDTFKMQYKSVDDSNRTFRQVLTSKGAIKEEVKFTNMNIPLVLKYKNQFSKKWGFTADAGILFNIQTKTSYTTNAAFDYEAIVKYQRDVNGNIQTVYDDQVIPTSGDLLITREYRLTQINNALDIYKDFATFSAKGYNVALDRAPNSKTGDYTSSSLNIGFIFQPAITYSLSDKVALMGGLYATYMPIKNSVDNNYRITDKVGSYTTLEKSVEKSNNISAGINLGARFYLGAAKDSDKDGIPDKRDNCPDVPGLRAFKGCPDRDGDSIIDKEDTCPDVFGLVIFHGCPDTDKDGIPDNEDMCPNEPGTKENKGCPDRDGDGIIDREDRCPDVKGLAQFKGCPDTDGDGIPDKDDNCPDKAGPVKYQGCPDTDGDGISDDKDKCIDTPGVAENDGCPIRVVKGNITLDMVRFRSGTATINPATYAIIDAAIEALMADENAVIQLDGHADNKGSGKFNNKLSWARATAVKRYMVKHGIAANRISIKGFGSKQPLAPNTTKEGRAQNRRVNFNLKYNNE